MIILLRLIIIGCCPPMLSMVVTKISCECAVNLGGELINTSLSDKVGQETGLAGHSSRVKSEPLQKSNTTMTAAWLPSKFLAPVHQIALQ